MAQAGYIYVLINPSMPGLVKIGQTSRAPASRVSELSAATGVPSTFILAYQAFTADRIAAESAVHAQLEEHRVSGNREFFAVEPHVAIDCVIKVTSGRSVASGNDRHISASRIDEYLARDEGDFDADEFVALLTSDDQGLDGMADSASESTLADDLVSEGDEHRLGLGEKFQSATNALAYYQRAARLGSAEAHERIADMYWHGDGVREDLTKAVEHYQASYNAGSLQSLTSLSSVYLELDDPNNSRKCWELYFAKSLHTPPSSVYERKMFALSLRQYFSATDRIGLDPRYAELLVENHEEIRSSYQESIGRNAEFEFLKSSLTADLRRFDEWVRPHVNRRNAETKRGRETTSSPEETRLGWWARRRRPR